MIQDFQNDLLGGNNQSARLPVLGSIRSGIKILKSGCTAADQALYDKMVAAGFSWQEIEDRLGKDEKGKSKVIPKNVNHFTVRAIDCRTNPENAGTLHELYADKEDGKIRHFPIVFLSNNWYDIIPHELMCWTARELKYRSKYKPVIDTVTGERGFERVCMTPVAYTKGVRPFGGRDYREFRSCDPKSCPDYQKGYCKLRGMVQGIIPGTKGAGVWEIHSTSIYSFLQMKEQLEMVQRITGRLQGLINEETKQPAFSLRKVSDSITRVNVDKGEAERTDQDLVYLETDIDVYELITQYQPKAMVERGTRATAALTGHVEETAKPTNGNGTAKAAEAPPETVKQDLPPVGEEFTPKMEVTEAETERRAIVMEIFKSWTDGTLTRDEKLELKKVHPTPTEDMNIIELKALVADIDKISKNKGQQQAGSLV